MPPERCLVATWPDGYKWPVPNATADMQPDEAKKVDKILWKSVDPRSGQPVQVIEISHAERGVWIATRIQPKIQLMQIQGYGDHNSDKAKKFMIMAAQKFVAQEWEKDNMEAAKAELMKELPDTDAKKRKAEQAKAKAKAVVLRKPVAKTAKAKQKAAAKAASADDDSADDVPIAGEAACEEPADEDGEEDDAAEDQSDGAGGHVGVDDKGEKKAEPTCGDEDEDGGTDDGGEGESVAKKPARSTTRKRPAAASADGQPKSPPPPSTSKKAMTQGVPSPSGPPSKAATKSLPKTPAPKTPPSKTLGTPVGALAAPLGPPPVPALAGPPQKKNKFCPDAGSDESW